MEYNPDRCAVVETGKENRFVARHQGRSGEAMMQRQAEQRTNPMLLLDPILDELKTVVDYHGVTVQKVAGAYTVTIGYRGDLPPEEVLRGSFRGEDGEDGAEWVRQHNPLLVADILDDAPEAQRFRLVLDRYFGQFSSHMRSWLSVPLYVGERLVGALGVDHSERGHYTSRDKALLRVFAEERATDIEHAILYADAARLADEAQAVLTVQQAIVRRRELPCFPRWPMRRACHPGWSWTTSRKHRPPVISPWPG
jgi:GAF domain-containing protein